MQRYFIEKNHIEADKVCIYGKDHHHMKNVMRFKPGDQVVVNTYDGFVYLAQILDFAKDYTELSLIKSMEAKNINYQLDLGLSLTKKDAFELALKKITELGVSGIIPLETERSIINIKDYEKKKERYLTILKESAEQSERNQIPLIYDITQIGDLNTKIYDYLFVAYAREDHMTLKSQLTEIKSSDKVLVVIGPEGGFSKTEIKNLKEKGFVSVSLGDTILRAETAAMYIASVFRFMVGE
ncbi:MAG: 16S rRNA (uracil(1498)-N(3))-methyltransferase [Candidatus Izemoplasmatales bacterium]